MTLTNLSGITSVRNALLCSALAAPSIFPVVAFAQTQSEPCVQLQQAANQINFQESDISEEEFTQVVQNNDPQQCEALLTQVNAASGVEGEVSETEQARVRLEDEVVIEGRAIIDQAPPSVQVEEQPAEVIVGSATPDVNVSQGAIDIVIRQGAPLISLDMPQPTITIEQPAPEIIITMPDPSVDVSNARPQVEVRQAEPRVQVTMAEPTVELDLYQATDPEASQGIEITRRQGEAGADDAAYEPEVQMTQSEAQIIYQDDEQQQANVTLSRDEPSIRFEQAEAQIEVTSAGEPQISWAQSGEPIVRFQDSMNGEENGEAFNGPDEPAGAPEDMQEGEMQTDQPQDGQMLDGQQPQEGQPQDGQQPQEGQPQDAPAQDGELQQDAQAQDGELQQDAQAQTGGPNVRREGYEGVAVEEVAVTELEGATVYGVQGTAIGEIGALVISENQAETVVVDVGDYLGTGERQVEIPFSDLSLLRSEDNGDVRVYIDASEERLMSYPEAN